MSLPEYDAPPPHERILAHFPANEQGLTELLIWLRERIGSGGGGGQGLQYHKATKYGADNQGDWLKATANDASTAPSVGYTDQAGNAYNNGLAWQFDTGSSDAPFAVTNDGGFLVDTTGNVHIEGGAGIDMESFGSRITNATDGGDWVGSTTGGAFTVDTANGTAHIDVSAGTLILDGTNFSIDAGAAGVIVSLLQTGTAFQIKDHLGNPIFEVDENGTITPSSSGIAYATANSGTWLEATMTSGTGSATGTALYLHDSSVAGDGMLILSDNGGITVEADAGTVMLIAATSSQVAVGAGVAMTIDSGSSFTVNDHLAAAISETADDHSFVHNLATGKTFTVKDGSGNPIFTLTG